jgi:endonuclease YncB( thermonuclease family)
MQHENKYNVRLKHLLEKNAVLITTEDKSGEDMKGKFGRILGDFETADGRRVTDIMIEEGHCVPYFGGSKEDVQAQHMTNRMRLISEGIVSAEEVAKAEEEMK